MGVLMNQKNKLKLVHFIATVWFMLCMAYIVVLALRQAGFHWWVIFSLGGHSALLAFLLVSLYLFAVFRGIDRGQKIEIEHPLTATSYYAVFYDICPLLGGLAGWVAMIGVGRLADFLLAIALGTMVTTFLVWIVVDPLLGFTERMLPACRRHRRKRLAKDRALRLEQQQERDRLLTDVLTQTEAQRQKWQEDLRTQAESLATLLATAGNGDFAQAQCQAVDIGVKAWQTGGLSCMQVLRGMAMEVSRQENPEGDLTDYISTWWDGIGTWRAKSLV